MEHRREFDVSEFNAEWARRIAEAERRARTAGRGDVADYLALRAANDLVRAVGLDWLLETFTAHAAVLNRHHSGAGISIAPKHDEAAHRFRVGHSTMVGKSLTLRAGVRSVTIEVGWPRTPADGIVRGGGLALAAVTHFGDRRSNEQFLLVRSSSHAAPPQWLVLEESGARLPLLEERVRRHVAHLLR